MRSDAMWLSLAMAADAHAAIAALDGLEDSLESAAGAADAEGPDYSGGDLAIEGGEVEATRGRGDTAERLLRRFLTLCESPRTSTRMLGMVKKSVEHEGGGHRFYSLFNSMALSPVMRLGGLKSNALRGELVASQLVGLAMMRYVIRVEPICSLDREEVVALMAPAIRATLSLE